MTATSTESPVTTDVTVSMEQGAKNHIFIGYNLASFKDDDLTGSVTGAGEAIAVTINRKGDLGKTYLFKLSDLVGHALVAHRNELANTTPAS